MSPETAYDLQRYTEEALVKGPRLLGPMKGDAFLAMIEAVKAAPAAPAISPDLDALKASHDAERAEWAARYSDLEKQFAAAQSLADGAPTAEALTEPLKARIAELEFARQEADKEAKNALLNAEEWRKQFQAADERAKAAEANLASATTVADELLAEKTKAAGLADALASAEAKALQAREELATANADLAAAKAAAAELDEKLAAAAADLSAEKAGSLANDSKIAAMAATVESARAEAASLAEENTAAKARIAELEAKVKALAGV